MMRRVETGPSADCYQPVSGMINLHLLAPDSAYCWLDLRRSDSVGAAIRYVSSRDNAAVSTIKHSGRRRASLLGRGLLHYLAGSLLRNHDYEIVKTAEGRPFLRDDNGNRIAYASISHSHDIVTAALDGRRSIGIDVEYCCQARDFRRIAQRIFSPPIASRIISSVLFYKAWCLYEAWGKANNLNHFRPGRNQGLIRSLEQCLQVSPHEKIQQKDMLFFVPARHYLACIYRSRDGEEA